MARPRTTYPAEFKRSAARMITEQELSVAETARRLDVGENRLREWRKAFLVKGDAAFPVHGTRPRPTSCAASEVDTAHHRADRSVEESTGAREGSNEALRILQSI